MNNNEDIQQLIAKYNKEMRELIGNIRKNAPVYGKSDNMQSKMPKKDEDAFESNFAYNDEYNDADKIQGDERFEAKNNYNDEFDDSGIKFTDKSNILPVNAALPVISEEDITEQKPQKMIIPAATEFGTIKIITTTANGAVPVKNAYVIISEATDNGGEKLLYTLTTNDDGETEPVKLRTYPEELSQNPDYYGKPYKTYKIKTAKDGFYTVVDKNVPIFANKESIQPVNMIPLPFNYKGSTVIDIPVREVLSDNMESESGAADNINIPNNADNADNLNTSENGENMQKTTQNE